MNCLKKYDIRNVTTYLLSLNVKRGCGGYSSGYKREGLVGYIPYYYTALCSWGKGWLLSHTWSYSVHSTQYAYYVMMMSHILYIYPHHICSISKSCRLLKEEELSCFHPIAQAQLFHQQHNSHWRYGKPLIFLSHGEHLYSAIVQKGLHSCCVLRAFQNVLKD